MRRFLPTALVPILWIFCGHALSQDAAVIKIGVPLLYASPNTVSAADARDQLAKALNQHKPDKKLPFTINAVPLATEWGAKAMEEAREEKCEFVLSMHLTDFRTSSALSNDGAQGLNYRPDYTAEVEYRLIRVADGAAFAVGSVEEEDPTSAQAAARLTVAHIAREAVAEIGKGGNVPHNAVPENRQLSTESKADATVFLTPRPCVWLPDNIAHVDSVRGVCQYALELPQTMPNFICDQETSRYRGKNKVPFDLLTALIRYQDGKESYTEIKLNGRPAPAALTNSPGLWSTGQFGANLRNIFDPWNLAIFEFSKENKLGDRDVWVFSYHIARQFDPLWRLHAEGNATLAPAYRGELWIDQKTGALLRFTSVAEDIPPAFPMAAASLEIDYSKVGFADGSTFLLPSEFTVNTTYHREESTRNVVQFRNCHKFRAKTQIVLDTPGKGTDAGPEEGFSAKNPQAEENEEAERIYAILREQAVREDESQLAIESTHQLDAATVTALSRLGVLEKRRQKLLAEVPTINAASSTPPDNLETTIKVSVKFVPVTVVLRDSQGKAVGSLRQEDFSLFDNGKPQPIASFAIEKSGEAREESAKKTSVEPASFDAEQASPVTRHYVAYVFDDIHSAFEDLAAAGQAAGRHLSALGPEDRAAIYALSGALTVDFTADRDKLQEALKRLRPHPITRGVRCPPISNYMADLIVNQGDREALGLATRDALNCSFGGMGGRQDPLLEERAEQVAKSTALEVVNATSMENVSTLNALREIFRRTAVAGGNRSIVLISPGFLMTTPDTRQAIMEMIDNAQRSDIVVNSVDIRGLVTPVVAPNMSHSANSVVQFNYDKEEAAARSEVMADLAYSTGGIFFRNSNDLDDGFRRAADAPEYIYVLGFSPQKLDGRFHKLKVTLKAPSKLQIQSRRGYYAFKSTSK
jgi:VWFA-related protein